MLSGFTIENLPMKLFQLAIYIPAIMLAMVLHEIAHGYVAYRCGDETAKLDGRLSLNPLRHIDPLGALFLLIFRVGWAKPVPINLRRLRKPLRDSTFVALAGVTVNFLLFVFFTVMSIFLCNRLFSPFAIEIYGRPFFLRMDSLGYILQISPENYEYLASAIQTKWLLPLQTFFLFSAQINLGLCLFNILPFPPLDGFHVVNNIFFKGQLNISDKAFMIIRALFFIVLLTTDVVGQWLATIMQWIQTGVVSGLLSLVGGV